MFSLPLLLLSLSTYSISISPTPPQNLIQKTCSTTTYYDFCMSSLSGDPKSQDSDVRGLSTIIINLAISNSTNTSSYALSLSSNSTNTSMKALLRRCSAKYSNASQALRLSMDAIQNNSFDDAFVHVSAAGEYPNVCRVLFRQQLKLIYPPEMMKREVVLERLCAVALDIISLLIQY
ncbi:putative pectinesterase inhibitor domain-containing protein [Dioscorea sansibarensis]